MTRLFKFLWSGADLSAPAMLEKVGESGGELLSGRWAAPQGHGSPAGFLGLDPFGHLTALHGGRCAVRAVGRAASRRAWA